MMLWLALLAQLAAPAPKNETSWVTADDVPDFLLKGQSGRWAVAIRLDVTADGHVRGCTIEATSKIRELDRYTCEIMRRRAKFLPARWTDGSASSGVYRTLIGWTVTDAPVNLPKLYHPIMDLTVNALPKGLGSPAYVRINFAAAADGSLVSCTAEPPRAKHIAEESNPALASAACEQLMKSYKPLPARDGAGNSTRSVQNAVVRFSVQP